MPTPVFPFRPNWARPVVERLEWLTDITEAKTGHEERIALRNLPRRALEYTALLQGAALQQLDALLWRHQSQSWLLPVWTDPQPLQVPVEAGADFVPADTALYAFAAGGHAVLWLDATRYEAVTVDAVSSDGITLSAPTTQAWPVGAHLYPAVQARMPFEVTAQRPSAASGQITLRFELQPVPALTADDAVLYRGTPVALRRPNWVSPVQQRWQRKLQRVDYETGYVFQDDLSGVPSLLRSHRLLLRNRAEISSWRGWLHARQGRAWAFWSPQWQHDLTLAAPITAAGNTISVRAYGATLHDLGAGRRDIALHHRRTGAWAFRRVQGYFGVDGLEVLTLDAPVGWSAAPGEVFATWLCLSRLEADAVELAWHTPSVAVAVYDVRSVQ